MSTRTDPPQISSYLAQLRHEAHSRLRADIADELVADVRADLAERIPAGATHTQISAALDRLGTPRELVDAAHEPPAATMRTVWVEIGALICLIASVLTFMLIGSMVILLLVLGLVPAMTSRRWTGQDKVLTILAFVVGGGPTLLYLAFAQSPPPDNRAIVWIGWTVLALVIAFHVYVATRLTRHALRPPSAATA